LYHFKSCIALNFIGNDESYLLLILVNVYAVTWYPKGSIARL